MHFQNDYIKMISPHLFEESITNCNERIIKRAYEKLMGKQVLDIYISI